ncbi:S-adenosyl-L-methionine-dependent methyltransferase [Ascobolus immersus RN42]|uniref:S-adenosyl-L-methionine-dependent methyltransferase n=1 Tax=Ascobolus immersus RN42 TaxID=1160509 RepID=A0A3N4IFA9_ASCIM|nr:S-adenosyl-L-methionine-dependent methyltransferase [Ascobolus immersus RN42]
MATTAPALDPTYPDPTSTIEIGEDDDSFSDTSSLSANSDTTSLTSSVFNYVYENGRRYASHRTGNYVLPNDEEEQERLDLTHHVYCALLGGELHLAPLDNPKNILDLGCGTGIWAIEMGDLYPECEIIGTDLSPIQPVFVPPNVSFEVDNWEDEWLFGRKFDMIHMRMLQGAVKDFDVIFTKAYDALAPGGWIELVECHMDPYSEDGTYERLATGLHTYFSSLLSASAKLGCVMDQTPQLQQKIKSAGFTNVSERTYKAPVGAWPKDHKMKEVGRTMYGICMIGAESYGLALFTRVLGMDEEEAQKIIEGARRDLGRRGVHTVFKQHIIIGQKPFETETTGTKETKTTTGKEEVE